METYAYCIQCKDTASGRLGSFMYSNREPFKAISPVFQSYAELHMWMVSHGYETDRDLVSFRVFKRID
jgi:hypothetical protein